MMSAGDLPFVAALAIAGALLTVVVFFITRGFTRNSRVLRLTSGFAVPVLTMGVAVGIEVWNPDPHGWVFTASLLLVAICLPITLLTGDLLARHFTDRNAPPG